MNKPQTPIVSLQSTIGVNYHEVPSSYKNSTFGFGMGDKDVDAIISALTYSRYPYGGQAYNDFREYYIGKLVTELKADLGIKSLTDMFDCFYMFATATYSDAYVNWAQPGTYDITLYGGLGIGSGASQINFTPNCGFFCNNIANATSTLNTNFNPFNAVNANFGKFPLGTGVGGVTGWGGTQSSGSYGLYLSSKSRILPRNVYEIGATTTGRIGGILFGSYNTGANFSVLCLAQAASDTITSSALPTNLYPGLFSVSRIGAGTEVYFNGQLQFAVRTTTPLNADRGPICICAPNVTNVPLGGTNVSLTSNISSDRQIAFVYIGSSDIKHDIVYYRVQQYLDAIGYNPTPGGGGQFLGTNQQGNW